MIDVIEVNDGNLDDFIELPSLLFSDDPFFIPQLKREMRLQFSRKNPFFGHADVRFYVARTSSGNAGRIVSFVNRAHNVFHGDRTGFFGFFDSVNDLAVSSALFDRAAGHLSSEGMTVMRGPMNFSTNEECGFLLEGFYEPPMLMTPYNPPYYNDLAAGCGFAKSKDLLGFIHTVQDSLPEKVLRVADLSERRGIAVRPINKKQFQAEMLVFKEVYNSAWERNWGFIPLTDEEVYYLGERLKQIARPELILIAEDKGSPVGFLGLLPDFNAVLKHMKGRLNPVTILKALYYSRKISDLRLLLLGINKEYRNKGIEALLIREGFKGIKDGGYKRVEFSWVLEDNFPVLRIIEMAAGVLNKKYRIYEKPL